VIEKQPPCHFAHVQQSLQDVDKNFIILQYEMMLQKLSIEFQRVMEKTSQVERQAQRSEEQRAIGSKQIGLLQSELLD
jgi:hypothetical protein